MKTRLLAIRVVRVLFACGLVTLAAAADAASDPASVPAEEFAGPFASWTQVQCGGVDDTAMLQAALDRLGTPGNSPVLYLKPGTCTITATLSLLRRENVTILGADPATTRVVWAGPAAGTMVDLNGVGHSRFGRITWDHGGIPGTIYESGWAGSGCCFPTDNRHEDEIYTGLVNTPEGGDAAFAGGRRGHGDGETEWIRCQFIGPAQVGIFLSNFNVLNYWVWDSLFLNNHWGISNTTETGNGAGGYAVNRSTFLNDDVDLGLGNTNFFASRWNYSRGARNHILGRAIGNAPAPWTVQGNTIIDASANPVDVGSPGPLLAVDNATRSNGVFGFYEGYSSALQSDETGIGNVFSNPDPWFHPNPGTRLRSVDEEHGATVDDPGPPAPPLAPRAMNRAVFEPSSNDSAGIQAAINQALEAGPRAIVHLPFGTYTIDATLEVPADATIQIVGDGYPTRLNATPAASAIFHLAGPNKSVLRDLSLHGSDTQPGISITASDQPGGVIHSEALAGGQNEVSVLVDGVQQTSVDLLDHQASASSSADFRLLNGSRVNVFNGAGCCSTGTIYDLKQDSTLVVQTMYFEAGPARFVAPASSGTLVLDGGKLSGEKGANADFSSFSGLATLQNLDTFDAVPVTGGGNFLSLGVVTDAGRQTAGVSPSAIWVPRTNAGSGGSAVAPEHSAGVADEAAFLREHEAPLRSAVPKALGDTGPGVTDVHLYRIAGEHTSALLSIQAS